MPRGGRLTVPKRTPSPGSRSLPRRTILMATSSSSPKNLPSPRPAGPGAISERIWVDEIKFELYPYSGQGPTLIGRGTSWESRRVASAGPHTDLRRRLLHLPLLGGLLAGVDRGARCVSRLSGGCGGLSGHPAPGIFASHSIHR